MLFSEPKIPQFQLQKNAQKNKQQFQCSSASRKFLNNARLDAHFPALVFQCSSASRKFLNRAASISDSGTHIVSVLFSEPKIPQFVNAKTQELILRVSVLFSEPKIPQSTPYSGTYAVTTGFSALQRAENSSIETQLRLDARLDRFQCSSASRKFLNRK